MIPKLDVLADGNDFQLLSPNWGITSALRRVGEEVRGMPPAFFSSAIRKIYKQNSFQLMLHEIKMI